MAMKMGGGGRVEGGGSNPQGPTGINQAGEGNNSTNKMASPQFNHDQRDRYLEPKNAPAPPVEAKSVAFGVKNGRGSHDPKLLGL